MTRKKSNQPQFAVTMIFIYILLFAAVSTYVLPVLRVTLPPVGSKSWSVRDVAWSIPKSFAPRDQKEGFKFDYDFVDFMQKIMPEDTQNPSVLKALPFFLGILVPITLVLAYLFILLSFFLAPLTKGGPLFTTSLLAVINSIYALAGTYYLGDIAQAAYHDAVQKAGSGILGTLAQTFVSEISVKPDTGLFVLCGAAVLVFVTNLYRRYVG